MSTAEAQAYADEIGALCIETSAKLNKGVQDLFVDISRRLPQPAQDGGAAGAIGEVADLRSEGRKGKGGKDGKDSGGGCC